VAQIPVGYKRKSIALKRKQKAREIKTVVLRSQQHMAMNFLRRACELKIVCSFRICFRSEHLYKTLF